MATNPFSGQKIKRKVWHYSGDVDIAHGGMFYNMDDIENGYADAVRVTAVSDAGGPDNMWWVERISINVGAVHVRMHDKRLKNWPFAGVGATVAEREAHRILHDWPSEPALEDMMRFCGWHENLEQWDKLTLTQQLHAMVLGSADYGRFDTASTEMIQIGKADPFWKPRGETYTPDKILRGNTSLRNYARSQCT